MTTMSKTKFRFEQLLSEIYAARLCKNNQQVRIIVLNQDQRKIISSVKIVVALTFMCLIIKILHLKFSAFGDV